MHCGESLECQGLQRRLNRSMHVRATAPPTGVALPPPHSPQSVVRATLRLPRVRGCAGPSERCRGHEEPAEYVQVLCPQHSGCTWFAATLCAHFEAAECFPDFASTGCSKPVPRGRHPWHSGARDYVVKTTITPLRTLAPWENASVTYRILLLRDPVQQFRSVSNEKWRANCGGLAHKTMAYDSVATRAWLDASAGASGGALPSAVGGGGWRFDAIVFYEDFARDPPALMRRLGLPPPRWGTLPASVRTHDVSSGEASRFVCHLTPFTCALYGRGYDAVGDTQPGPGGNRGNSRWHSLANGMRHTSSAWLDSLYNQTRH